METLLTPANITVILLLVSILFSIFLYFKNPQIASEKRDALFVQQMKFMSDSVDRRFSEMQESYKSLLSRSENHIHTVDTKVEMLNTAVGSMGNQITRLGTIIEERIPKHHKV